MNTNYWELSDEVDRLLAICDEQSNIMDAILERNIFFFAKDLLFDHKYKNAHKVFDICMNQVRKNMTQMGDIVKSTL